MMSSAARVLKLLVAAAIAFSPSLTSAYASSGKARVNAQVLSLEELKSEFGAGGGGGGSDSGSGGSVTTLPSCAYNLDNDRYCDLDFEQVGIEHAPGSGANAYQNITPAIALSCNPTFTSDAYCQFNLQVQFGVSATLVVPSVQLNAPFGTVGLGGLEVGANVTGAVSTDYKVTRGYINTVAIQKQGNRYFGYYRFAFYDMSTGFWTKTGESTMYARTWEKFVWRTVGPVTINSRKWW